MRKSTLPEINWGLGYYANFNLKRYGKLSNAASLLRGIKDSACRFAYFIRPRYFKRRGNYADSAVIYVYLFTETIS